MKASDLFVQSLTNEGVKTIFAVPGEENLDLLESLRNSNIQIVLCRHEQSAGFMAATHGRLTGTAGVCLSTLGPGATNLNTAAAYAQLGAMPMLMITGQKPIKKSKQGHFQVLDVVAMMRPITKSTKQIVNGNTIPALVREAFRTAQEERPGVVHLELPEDIAREVTDTKPFAIHSFIRPVARRDTIEHAAKLINQAKRPLLLIGAGANRKRISKAITKLIDDSGFYYFNTQMGKGVVDERHAQYLGTAALSENDYIHCAIERADLILNIGHDIIEKPPFLMDPDSKRTVLHLNFFSATIDEVYNPHYEIIGDIAGSIELLTPLLSPKNWDTDYFKRIKTHVEENVTSGCKKVSFPVTPHKLVSIVREAMPDDGIIALDNGLYKIYFARSYKAYYPNTILLDNALATMGAGFASALCAKIECPDKKVMGICGDGGFMMNHTELETAVRLKLDLVILLLTDNAYGMIRWKQGLMDLPDFGLEFNNPDFVELAKAYGANGHRISETKELFPLLKQCLNTSGVHIIDAPIDYSESLEEFGKKLQEKTCLL